MTSPRQIAAGARPIVLSIGTTEPLISAGILLDLLIADRLEVRPVAVIAGISAQDGQGQLMVEAVSVDLVRAQLQSCRNLSIAAVRLGAIPCVESIVEVAQFLQNHAVPTILDPVIATSAGGRLLSHEAVGAMQTLLFPQATLVTPNLDECTILCGYEVRSVSAMDAAAWQIVEEGAQAVLIKGGHLAENPVDVFWDGKDFSHDEALRIDGDMRGTGCALAMTITAALAHGYDLRQAIQVGREIIRHLIPIARNLGNVRAIP